ncbi:MAG: flagellar hook capping protein [Elusimicrobia bacterium]|jgi:flagellar basal-body rod modification protein FlgD|nr:flagellar hook capping protein [Elusimicrobiota bacterium]
MPESIDAVSSADASKTSATRNTGGLGKSDFLKLLTTQLEHQDPLNPASEQEMVGTLAQFSSLEQTEKLALSMEALTRSNQWSQGQSILGRIVVGKNDAGNIVTGKVFGMRMEGDQMLLDLGDGVDLPLAGLTEVFA